MIRRGVLITGAGRGIGAATARLLAANGYDICVNFASDRDSALSVVAACEAQGACAFAVQGNVASDADVAAMFDACDRFFAGPFDLVNNAGILGTMTRFEAADPAMIRDVFDVNVMGTILCSQQAVRRLSAAHGGKGGAIVNISSIAASLGSPGEYVHYAASKAAIDTLTAGLAKEVGPFGVRVNAVQAGTVETDIHAQHGNPDRPAAVAATAPLRRAGMPQDIAQAVKWLLSDEASYVTGTVLRVGGGL